MNHFDAVSTLFVFGFAILFLAGGVVLLLFRKKLASLTVVDERFIAGGCLVFAWPRGSLMILTHQIVLCGIATLFWLAYRLFKVSLGDANRRANSRKLGQHLYSRFWINLL